MAEMIRCPSCARPLQVPEDLWGTLVQCPACGATFTAAGPAPGEPVSRRPDTLEEATRLDRPTFPARSDEGHVRGVLAAPAICLIVIGCLGFLFTLQTLIAVLNGELHAALQQAAPPDPRAREIFQRMAEFSKGPGAVTAQAVFLAVNALIVLGAIAILRRRLYGLAVVASILAIVDFGPCCCVAGLPIGIWSLTVLSR